MADDVLNKLRSRLPGGRVDLAVIAPGAAAVPGGRLAGLHTKEVRRRRVYVGLDFGTCSCKAVVQVDPEESGRRRFFAVAHPGTAAAAAAAAGRSSLLCPSTVDVRGGRFHFGYQAEAEAGVNAVRS